MRGALFMETPDATSSWHAYDAIGVEEWDHLYLRLYPLVRRWVSATHVPGWRGQESSVVEDIVQNTMIRVLHYMQRAEHQEVGPITSIQRLADVIAHLCYTDMWRHDRRVLPIDQESYESAAEPDISTFDDLLDVAINNIHQELLFAQIARWIVSFPEKQRTAFLIDLANRMHFDRFSLTPLQQAFANVGIPLQEYQQPVPQEAKARAQHAANLSLAYKRLTQMAYWEKHMTGM
jgi:DNA-directed RNA polymerase specialized sigma24 family protein